MANAPPGWACWCRVLFGPAVRNPKASGGRRIEEFDVPAGMAGPLDDHRPQFHHAGRRVAALSAWRLEVDAFSTGREPSNGSASHAASGYGFDWRFIRGRQGGHLRQFVGKSHRHSHRDGLRSGDRNGRSHRSGDRHLFAFLNKASSGVWHSNAEMSRKYVGGAAGLRWSMRDGKLFDLAVLPVPADYGQEYGVRTDTGFTIADDGSPYSRAGSSGSDARTK